ncbi:MAG: Fe(3+) ABC transporter substrate-binding protein [Gammaproteobacteria bacterium]|nr:Fe(3+) ABC transporter substrate-binding protein [Gammaproteobacteria bacterium]
MPRSSNRPRIRARLTYAVLLHVLVSSVLLADEEINVYSARHYDTDMDLYAAYTRQTGVKVNLIEGGSDALIERIVNEGEFSPADVLITVDAGRLWRAQNAGVFQPIESAVLSAQIPAHLREKEGHWYGLSKRARVIVASKLTDLPIAINQYEDLANEALRGLVCMRSSSNIYNLSLMASLIDVHGPEAAEQWAAGVVANFARSPQGNDTANITAIASGECGLTLANTYYIGRMLASEDEDTRKMAQSVQVVFPNQDGRGTHVNISGAGITKFAPNRDHAIRFIEYLTSDYAQRLFAEGNNEYAVIGESSGPIATLGTFSEDDILAQKLGENQSEAVRVFDRAGWL